MLKELKHFNFEVWLLMVFNYLNRLGFFMSVPYFAFYLTYLHFSPILIGCIVASQAISYSLVGIPSGFLSDYFGKKNAMIISLLLNAIACVGLAHSKAVLGYFIFNILFGAARSLFDAAMPAYLTDVVAKELHRFAFNFRFTIINIAGATGPLIGIYFANRHSVMVFEYSAVIFFLSAALIQLYLRQDKQTVKAAVHKIMSFKNTLKVMQRDKKLLYLTIATVIYYFAYMQLEAPLAQALVINNPATATWLFGLMWVVNTLIIVVLQMPLSGWLKNCSMLTLAYIGSLLMALSFVGMAFYTGTWTFTWSIVLLTLGEMALSPINTIVIAHIAPEEIRGSYFGAISLATIGMGIGPIIGGVFLQYSNSKVLFLSGAVLLTIGIWFYRKSLNGLKV